MFDLTIELAIAAVIIALLYLKNFKTLEPITGIYRQNSRFYYLKFCAMYILLKIRKRKEGKHEDIDKRQTLSDNPLAVDAVYFNGASENKCILGIGTAQRRNGVVNGFCILRVPKFSNKTLVNLKFPDSSLIQTKEEAQSRDSYAVEGIKVKPVAAMHSWRLTYNGKMKFNDDDSKLFDVSIDAVWSTNLPYFNFDVHMSPTTLARAVAMEPWSREYFHRLESFHQTHYEQYGEVRGNATIDGIEYPIFTNSVRDHSYADSRDWKNIHRYALHFMNFENGDRISFGAISMPVTFSTIEIGFVTIAAEKRNYPITCCDLKLYQHGEHNYPPKDYAFTFWAGNKNYVMQVTAYSNVEFYMGQNAESRVIEMYSEFNVNGIKGWGVVEWSYRHVDGLPK